MIRLFAKLIRLDQWYKNLIIFAPLIFAGNVYPITQLIIGFFGFSCVSSITYIVNDWMDREGDRLHPIKKNRPLASGKITGKQAILVGVILSLIVAYVMLTLGIFYTGAVGIYFVITNLYSFGLKHIPLVDIFIIATNFALRMMAGTTSLPGIDTLPYFGLLIGSIIIFLTHKRSSDIKLLGEKAAKHKPVLRFYTIRNNYIFRSIAYLIVIGSFYLLWQAGLETYKVVGLYLQLLATSFIFSENPEYTSKPQWLFRSKIWSGLIIANLIIFLVY